jgi:hypothetical protein
MILRYDGDYGLIAHIAGQPVPWAVLSGTVS